MEISGDNAGRAMMLTDVVVEIMEGGSVPVETVGSICDAYVLGHPIARQRRTMYRVVEVLARKTGTDWAALGDTADGEIDAHFRDNLTRAAQLPNRRPAPLVF